MTRSDKIHLACWLAALAFIVFIIFTASARSQDNPPFACPTPAPCKVITITEEEEKVLLDSKGILDTALVGRPLDLTAAVFYFKLKILTAPHGAPAK